ncbi:MAG: molybdate ABC transporter substrate-binding protein [Kiloniellaceae bacterium]
MRPLFAAAVSAALLIGSMTPTQAADQPLRLYAAGSLKTALGEVARHYEKTFGSDIETAFGPSGLMRGRIEKGETAHVFASANMRHPQTLQGAGRGGPVALFARNKLCALVQPGIKVASANLLDVMLDPAVRLGTSTPKADPSGDYAWALFAKAEAVKAGAQQTLESKAMQLTGGPDSAKAPEGRNTYGWVMESGKADIFLTYCTNAVLAQKEVPDLEVVAVPPELAVGADYGLIVLDDAPAEAWRLAFFILSPAGQEILAGYGFESGALPAK